MLKIDLFYDEKIKSKISQFFLWEFKEKPKKV